MTLIKSISGIRGTIGGPAGHGLTPTDIVSSSAAFAALLQREAHGTGAVVVGRDARISGPMVHSLVVGTLRGMGLDVIDLGLATTPTVEMAVVHHDATGGIILTASHNPKQWNALKLLDHNGEFISAAMGQRLLELAEAGDFDFAEVDELGGYTQDNEALQRHIEAIKHLDVVDLDAIEHAGFSIAVDAVNSVGGFAVPALLEALGVQTVHEVYCDPTGDFPHNPEPLPEHLTDLRDLVVRTQADLGIVVDPDVDRLALVCEDGSVFGEEYTLVACADHVLREQPGPTVSNLSSSRALADVTARSNKAYHASAVGEVNVVATMKEVKAVIGGEGNGGVILPALHHGRDALVGIALVLSRLAQFDGTASDLRASYPAYHISKNKMDRSGFDLEPVLEKLAAKYADERVDRTDGLKIDLEAGWVLIRKSNTEPIIRIYSEGHTPEAAEELAEMIQADIRAFAGDA